VGSGPLDLPGVPIEIVNWSEASETAQLHGFDIGIMPLTDDPWARGKCGFKLIQYMACGLPVVASPVGVNCQIVEHGGNGYLAGTEAEWVSALTTLLDDAALRERLGRAGRLKVEQRYCLQKTGPELAALLQA
jgi:glycosyltransferase involved in cell wall biosynthesis